MALNFRAFLVSCLFLLMRSTEGSITMDEDCINYTVYPLQYELNIYPHMYTDGQSDFHCELTITVIANVPNVQLITLDASDLELQGTLKVLDRGRDIVNGPRPYEYNRLTGRIYIYLNEPMEVYTPSNDRRYHIKISFTKKVKENGEGIFLVKYYDAQSKSFKYMFTTRLSPYNAKYFFPCFDNPRFEAGFKFKVFILHEKIKGMQYTNTSVVIAQEHMREIVKDDYIIVDYAPSPQVALYQVGFHYSNFASIQHKAKNTNDTLIVWAPVSQLKDFTYVLHYGIRIIDIIHEYEKINRPLMLGPINLVAVPTILNGYEIGSWNLLTNAAHRLINIEEFTSIKQIERMTFELAQQLSRIWLGNPGEEQITRWKEEWFKEGMAAYFACYFLTQYNHGIHSANPLPLGAYGLKMKHTAMANDWHHSTPALETFNKTLAIDIPSRYRDLVAMKTGAILWMLENWVESEKFHQSLMNYINSRRGKFISLQDFTATLDHDTIDCLHQFFNGSTASRILKSWFRRPGYPVIYVNVLRDRTPNAIQLKQRQFSMTRENRFETDYLIPISYIVQHNRNCFNCYRPRFTIGAQTYTFGENLNGGWIILNRKGSGYYRVNYNAETWQLIANALKENPLSIDELNRAQIVNDVLALFVAGDLSLPIAMDVLDYLDQEKSSVVWEAVITGFDLFTGEGNNCNMTKHLYWEWENFMIKKVAPIFDQFVKDQNQLLSSRLFKSNIIDYACSLNYEPCQSYVRRMYLENKRGQHHLFPDCRASYFYVLANETFSETYSRELNIIEQDDKHIAEHRIHNKNRFLIKIPIGEPIPINLMKPTTTYTTDAPAISVTEKLQTASVGGSGTINKFSFTVILTLIMCNLFFR